MTRSYLLLAASALLMLLIACGTNVKRHTVGEATITHMAPGAPSVENDHKTELPLDPNVVIGQLDNGLTYYVRQNQKPENRAELRLVVNAGSVLEDEDQQGLAHFAEHMAFNGTESFEKQELVDYLEAVGMRFGPDLNAYTSFDETVYMLQIPMDSSEIVETAFNILYEWACKVSFDDEEIDKERGVVGEEWRLGRGAQARMRDQQFPVLFHESRYAERLPIGKKAVIDTFDYDAAKRYYRDWYRPDLMAIVAVGDFDVSVIENRIRNVFGQIPARDNIRTRTVYEVPPHDSTLFAIATDPEATSTRISVYYKRGISETGTEESYRRGLVRAIYHTMFNARLNELRQSDDPPFLFAYSGEGQFVRTMEAYILGASTTTTGLRRGLQTLLEEAARVKQHGFTSTELARVKKQLLRQMERNYTERDKTESRSYASEYIRNYLESEPIPGIVFEYDLTNRLVPGISLEEVNQVARAGLTDANRVFLINAPEKEKENLPTESELVSIFEAASKLDLTAYVDKVSDEPLIAKPPSAGSIVAETTIDTIDLTTWTLSNGITVHWKPTTFKNDQVIFSAYSPGGHSLSGDEDYIAAITASTVIGEGGVGVFDKIKLQKKLTGKVASVSPWIAELEEGMSGGGSPQDLETLFQLIHLYVTAPRQDSTAFISYRKRIEGLLENRDVDPGIAFSDTISVNMSQNHFRRRPWSKDVMNEMDLQVSYRIYQDRFADMSDFTFIFVGNIDGAALRALTEKYLASLPAQDREENWKDVNIDPPKGKISKTVYRGLEPKSQVRLIMTGPFEWSRQNRYDFNAMISVMRIKLREVLREDHGGTYGVRVSGSGARIPEERFRINISFGCAPERVSELKSLVFEQLDSLKLALVSDIYIQKVQETQRRTYETSLERNRYWLNSLEYYFKNDISPAGIYDYPNYVDGLESEIIHKTANKYLTLENLAEFVLYPEGFEE